LERRKKMKNLKQIARATTLTGIIILTTVATNAEIIVDRTASTTTNPCEETSIIINNVDSILSSMGLIDDGTVCGIIVD
jgi:hypothetical protein